MSKVKYVIEMDEDEYKRVKNAECSYDGFEKGTFGYYLDIIQKTATPIAESNDCVSIQAVNEILLKYVHSEEGKLFTEFLISQIKDLPSIAPKREQGEYDEDYKTLQIKLENAEDVIENLKEDLRQAREDLRYAEMR